MTTPTYNPPALGRALLALAMLLDFLDELIDLPDLGPCRCKDGLEKWCQSCMHRDLACDARGIRYTVEIFESLLNCQEVGGGLATPGGRLRKYLEDNKADWPDPDRLAEAILRLIGQDDDTADEPAAIVAGVA